MGCFPSSISLPSPSFQPQRLQMSCRVTEMFGCRYASLEFSLEIPVALHADQHTQSLSHQLQCAFFVCQGEERAGDKATQLLSTSHCSLHPSSPGTTFKGSFTRSVFVFFQNHLIKKSLPWKCALKGDYTTVITSDNSKRTRDCGRRWKGH